MKRFFSLFILQACLISLCFFSGCSDDSTIGSSLTPNEVKIEVDSTFVVTGQSVYTPTFDSRTLSQLAGSISAKGYGDLSCSYVTQFMPALQLSIPDSIKADDLCDFHLRLHIKKGSIVGDSLLPQRLNVYKLKKAPDASLANNTFDPLAEGYCSAKDIIGTKSFTMASALKGEEMLVSIPLPMSLARDFFNKYRTTPSLFEWPSTLATFFPGIFVKSSFGQGCLMNVSATEMTVFWKHKERVTVIENNVGITKDSLITDSCTFLASAPEVLSFNNIKLKPSDDILQRISSGKCVLMSPAGYNVRITFPAQAILDRYWKSDFNLAVINDLSFSIPVSEITNDYGIQPPPQILLVKTSELESFFANNQVPDAVNSFYASYSSTTGQYTFNSMRGYVRELMKAGKSVKPEDYDFTIIPVVITTETNSYTGEIVPSTCTPYTARPTMCILNIDKAKVKFTYSLQSID